MLVSGGGESEASNPAFACDSPGHFILAGVRVGILQRLQYKMECVCVRERESNVNNLI